MMRFGESLPPLNKKVKYIGTAHSIPSKQFRKELKELKSLDKPIKRHFLVNSCDPRPLAKKSRMNFSVVKMKWQTRLMNFVLRRKN